MSVTAQLHSAMAEAESHVAASADVDEVDFCRQVHPDFSPLGWHLGHIGVPSPSGFSNNVNNSRPCPPSMIIFLRRPITPNRIG